MKRLSLHTRIISLLACALFIFCTISPNGLANADTDSLQIQVAPVETIKSDGGIVSAPNHSEHNSLYRRGNLASTLPDYYQLPTSKQTSVKDQNPYGTCWAHAAMASAESSIKSQGQASDPDLSEWQLAYFTYTAQNGRPAFDLPSGETPFSRGGNDYQAIAMLARGSSPVLESQAPYDKSLPSPSIKPSYELKNTYTAHTAEEWKTTLMSKGALSISYNHSNTYYNSTNSSYYQPSAKGYTNHAVTLVGWDDNYPAANFGSTPLDRPPGNGAWIIKNSWGSLWGDEGYFYLSYYCADLDGEAIFYEMMNPVVDEREYTYADLGWTGKLKVSSITPDTGYMKCRFTAIADESLESVATFAVGDNTSYSIQVNTKNPSTDGYEAAWDAPQVGNILMAGFSRIDLAKPVALTAGQSFEVVICLTVPDASFPLPTERVITNYSSEAVFAPAQSFASSNGVNWFDLYNYGCDACIYAFTDTTPDESARYNVTFNSQGGSAVASIPASYNTTIIAPAAPTRTGYTFGGWYKQAGCTTAWVFATDKVKGNTTLFAKWTANTYTISYVSNGGTGGSTTVSNHVYDTSRTLTANGFTRTGYSFTGWAASANGPMAYTNSQSVLNLTATNGATVTLFAKWIANKYAITTMSNNIAWGTVSGGGSIAYGTAATVKALPKTGYRFVRWLEGSTSVSTSASFTFTVTKARSLKAEFAPIPYALTLSVNNTAWGTVAGGGSIAYGTAAKLTATPKAGYRFVRWLEGSTAVSTSASYTFTVSKARTLKAEFAKIGTPAVKAVSAGYNAVKLSWAAVAGAQSYEISRYDTVAKLYKVVATVTTTNYTNTGLTTNTTYSYKVRVKCAAGSTVTFGGYSIVASCKPLPAAPTGVVAARVSSSSIKISWSKVTGANGYEISRATASNGAYKPVKSVTALNLTNTGLVKGKTYYYKVRSYCVVNGAKVYSPFSMIVSAKP